MPCPDGPKAEVYTEDQLNHLDRALNELGQISGEIRNISFRALPDSLKMEYNYSNWKRRG